MTARRFFFLGLVLALAVFTPGCAGLPDRWTLEEKTAPNSHSGGRWEGNEVGVSISGPIPHPGHE